MNAAEQIIARFGGPTKLAQLLGLRESTVRTWRDVGRIPATRQRDVLEQGHALDPPLKPADFFEPIAPRRTQPERAA